MKRKIIFCLIETIQISDSDSSSSSDISELSDSSSEDSLTEEEDTLFFPLIKYLTSVKRRRIENYLAVVESMTDSEFKEHFWLSRRTAYKLIRKRNIFIILIIYLIGNVNYNI